MDPHKCELYWMTKLKEYRDQIKGDEERYWPEQLVLDANLGGDEELALEFMEQHGWWAGAAGADASIQEQRRAYLMPNRDKEFGNIPVAVEGDGVKLACKASWVSGVPFVSVIRRGSEGRGIIYQVSYEGPP